MSAKEFLKREWIHWLIISLPFIFSAFIWNSIPQQVPMHWNYSGEIDRYETKEFAFLFMVGINILLYFMFLLLPKIDPRRKNYKFFQKPYQAIRIAVSAFLCMMLCITLAVSLGYNINVGKVVIFLTLILFLVLGNYMGNLRSNYFVGIRLPWTLENTDVWTRTHRFAGKIWVAGSLLMIIAMFYLSLEILTVVYFVFMSLIIGIPVIYSYVIYKRIKNGTENNEIEELLK